LVRPVRVAKSRVQSVSKVLRVLEVLADSPQGEMGISEAARVLGWHRTTVYRFMQTLVEEGYVRYLPDGERYRLTFRLVGLANRMVSRLDICQLVRPHLVLLVQEWEINAHLAVLEEGDVVFIDHVECSKPLRTHFHIGRRAPAHATAVGKVLLADLEEDAVLEIIRKQGLRRFTPLTVCDEEALLRELNEVRVMGYAVDRGEHNHDVACVAAPVRDVTGRAVAGISLSGSVSEIFAQDVAALGESVREAAKRISADLGWEGL